MSNFKNKENMEPSSNVDNDYLKEHIIKLKAEIEKLQNEGASKEKCLQTYLREEEDLKKLVKLFNKKLEQMEHIIKQQSRESSLKKRFLHDRFKEYSRLQCEFLQEVQKCEALRNTTEEYWKHQVELEDKIQNIEKEFAKQNGKLRSVQVDCNTTIQNINVECELETEKAKKEIAELQSTQRRLEIKINSLETSLNQKLQECQEMSKLYDDISGKKSL